MKRTYAESGIDAKDNRVDEGTSAFCATVFVGDRVNYTPCDLSTGFIIVSEGISACRQMFECLFDGKPGYTYEDFVRCIHVTKNGPWYTIHTQQVLPVKELAEIPHESLYDPTATWSSVMYDIDEVADKFNELSDLKAVSDLDKYTGLLDVYPFTLLPLHVSNETQNLGHLHMDISDKGIPTILQHLSKKVLNRRFAILFITMVDHLERVHSNVVVFMRDKTGKYSADRFEPHGSDIGTKNKPNVHQTACEFNAFYNTHAMDKLLERTIHQTYSSAYVRPDANFPVLGQSLSNRSGKYNKNPTEDGGFRRRDSHLGDPLCAAHTVYYAILRLLNPEISRSDIYQHRFGAADMPFSDRGAWSSDQISHFILWAHNKSQIALQGEQFKRDLDEIG